MSMKTRSILELLVLNHAGVLSHITGLFSRRAFNLEGIICAPIGSGEMSKILLYVLENGRLEQVVKQLGKLCDVKSISVIRDDDAVYFERLRSMMEKWHTEYEG